MIIPNWVPQSPRWLSLIVSVAEEFQDAAEGVADHGRANVAHVHRLGDVGRRNSRARNVRGRLGLRHAEAVAVRSCGRDLRGDPIVLEPQIDEPGPRHLRRLAEVGQVDRGDQLLGDLARRPAEPLAQRHGEVRLVVAEFRVLARQQHRQQARNLRRLDTQRGQAGSKPFSKQRQDIHAAELSAPRLTLFVPRQGHSLGRVPEVLQRVEPPRLAVEQVNHDRAVVEQNPAAIAVAFDPQPLVAQLVFETVVDFVARSHGAGAGCCRSPARSSRTPP